MKKARFGKAQVAYQLQPVDRGMPAERAQTIAVRRRSMRSPGVATGRAITVGQRDGFTSTALDK